MVRQAHHRSGNLGIVAEEQQVVSKQHPVPQQVLGIEFKLVGDLTVRQFLILAVFGLFAFIFFSSNLFFLLRFLLTGVFLLAGAAFAFLPVQDQPLDQWLAAFFRAVYAPTRRVWVKTAELPEFLVMGIPKLAQTIEHGVTPEESRRRLETFLATLREEVKETPLDLAERQSLEAVKLLARGLPVPVPVPAVGGAPPKAPVPPRPALPEMKFVEVQKIQRRPSLASRINFAVEPVFKVQRGEEAQYFTTRRNIRAGRPLGALLVAGEAVYTPVRERVIEPILPEAPVLPPVSEIQPPPPPPPTLPTTIRPNEISGTVYDSKGGPLAQILVEVKNEKGSVVRATKTNELGKFGMSPLPTGRYTLVLPKAPLHFVKIELELTGKPIAPLEIKAKG